MWLSMLDGYLHHTCTSKISFSKLSPLPFFRFFWFFHLFFGFLCRPGLRKHEKSCSKPFQAIESKSDCIKISRKWRSASTAPGSKGCAKKKSWYTRSFYLDKLLTCAYGTGSKLASQGGGLWPKVNIGLT